MLAFSKFESHMSIVRKESGLSNKKVQLGKVVLGIAYFPASVPCDITN